MRFLDKILFNKEDDCFRYCLVLDIGTEYLKAALLEYRKEERNIIMITEVILLTATTTFIILLSM